MRDEEKLLFPPFSLSLSLMHINKYSKHTYNDKKKEEKRKSRTKERIRKKQRHFKKKGMRRRMRKTGKEKKERKRIRGKEVEMQKKIKFIRQLGRERHGQGEKGGENVRCLRE